jgi:hypothetical protein
VDPVKPEALKTTKGWPKWFEKLKNYLGQIRGSARVPLVYVIREHEAVDATMRAAVYPTEVDRLIAITSLNGEHYRIDNTRVWQEIKALVIDGFGWSYIKRFERQANGRGAILALKRQCEGESSLITRKNSAYASIKGATYRGPRKTYTFSQYVSIHQEAHNELQDCEEAVPESKKVSDFLAGISCPALQAGLTVVMGDPTKLASFDLTQQYLSTLVTNQAVHNKTRSDERGVAVSDTKGRGKGKGKGKGKPKVEDRFYSREEWSMLTPEERTKVIELGKERRKKKGSGGKRTAAAADSMRTDDEPEAELETPPMENGGDEFGRTAHKKKKVKFQDQQ